MGKKNILLEEIRDSLLQRLLSGQIDISEIKLRKNI